jgi:hypothetical protein
MNTLDRLISELKEVRDNDFIFDTNYDKETNRNYIELEYRKIGEISALASEVLFSDRGRLNFAEREAVQREGFTIIQVRISKSKKEYLKGWTIAGIVIPRKGVIAFENDYLLKQIEEYGEEN